MRIFYTFIVAVFFSGLFYCLINYVLVPYTDSNMLDIENLSIVSGVFIMAVAAVFATVHQIIARFFFRKFYKKTRIFPAVRRGVLLGTLLVSLAWLKVFGFWAWHIVLFDCVLILLFEALAMSFHGMKRGCSKDEVKGRK